MKNEAIKVPWSLGDVLRVLGVTILLTIVTNVLLTLAGVDALEAASLHKSVWRFGLFLLQELLVLVPLYYLLIYRHQATWGDLGLRSLRVSHVGLACMAVVVVNVVFYYLGPLFDAVPGFAQQEPHLPFFGSSTLDRILAATSLVIIAPIIEEIFFRGCVLQTLAARFAPWLANGITALFFAFLHFEFQSFWIIFILALVINGLFLKTRSLYTTIAFHILNNAIAFAVEVWGS